MKHIAVTGLAIGLTTFLAGCGWVDSGRLERDLSVAEDAVSSPHGHPSLPPGHPPITRGQRVLPPGHPSLPDGATCPGGGVARHPSGERFRDSSEVISI